MALMGMLELIAKVPFVGHRAVKYGIAKGTQRFGCSSEDCGYRDEVRLRYLLSEDVGPIPLLREGELTLARLLATANDPDPGNDSPKHRSTNSSDEDSDGGNSGDHVLKCPQCGGRLGVHLYQGDAVNGDKDEALRLIVLLLKVQPDLIEKHAGHLIDSLGRDFPVHKITTDDIFWSDTLRLTVGGTSGEYQRSPSRSGDSNNE